MTRLHLLFIFSVVPLLCAQHVQSRAKRAPSSDLPEDYHMATASSGHVPHRHDNQISATNQSIASEESLITTAVVETATEAATGSPFVREDPTTVKYDVSPEDLTEALKINETADLPKDSTVLTKDAPVTEKISEPTTITNPGELVAKTTTESNDIAPVSGFESPVINNSEIGSQKELGLKNVREESSENETSPTKAKHDVAETSEIRLVSPTTTTERNVIKEVSSQQNVLTTRLEQIVLTTTALPDAGRLTLVDEPNSFNTLVPESSLGGARDYSPTAQPPTPSDIPSGRSFTMDLESSEEGVDVMERRSDDGPIKPHKFKKKIRGPKTSTERLILDSSITDRHDLKETDLSKSDNVTEKAEPRNFFTYSTTTTEIADVKHTTSSLVIGEKIVNNNLLNVIDTSARPEKDSTETLLNRVALDVARSTSANANNSLPFKVDSAAKNTIRFGEDFGTTGQTDWVPLVSEQVSGPGWPQLLPSTSSAPPRRPRPSMSRIRFPDEMKESSRYQSSTPTAASAFNETDAPVMDVASWALATSKVTRQPVNGSVEVLEHVSFVTPPNNTMYSVLREKLQTAYARATERLSTGNNTTTERVNYIPITKEYTTEDSSSINVTKDQVLKNTIPDVVDITKNTRWRPVVTIAPFSSTTVAPDVSRGTNAEVSTTQKTLSEATTDSDSTEQTLAYEIMKVSSTTPGTLAKNGSDISSSTLRASEDLPTEKIFVNIVDDEVSTPSHFNGGGDSSTTEKLLDNAPAAETPTEKRGLFDTSSWSTSTTTTTSTTDIIDSPSEETSKSMQGSSTSLVTPFMQKLREMIAKKLSTTELPTVRDEEMTATTQRVDPSVVYNSTDEDKTVMPHSNDGVTVLPENAPFNTLKMDETTPKSEIEEEITLGSNKTTEEDATISPDRTKNDETAMPPKVEETQTETAMMPEKDATLSPEVTEDNSALLNAAATENSEFATEVFYPEKDDREKTDDENATSGTPAQEPPIIDEVTEMHSVPAYLRLTVEASQVELCHKQYDLRAAILEILRYGTNSSVDPSSVVLLNLTPSICYVIQRRNWTEDALVGRKHVNMLLRDGLGQFDKNLSEIFLRVWGEGGLFFPLPILKVDLVTPLPDGELQPMMGGGVVAAIVISVIAGLCLILLGMLFVIMKRRQKKFNYGQRCTPVSLDAYSLDSVSIRNSSRRKGARASKRSYGNPAFDDPDIPSHPVNFAGLANFALEKHLVHEEFSNIPQVAPRPEELPPGAEAKNRYANVIPLPETRVLLTKREGDLTSDYINANFVKGVGSSDHVYIAAQAPLQTTLADWWRMIWEQQVKVILMVTALHENGVEKCAEYVPPNEVTDSLRLYGDFHISLKKRDVKDKYIVSTLQLKNMEGNLWREVTHLWYVGWPDSGVPAEPNSLIAFLIEARSQIKTTGGTPSPTLVHCSPGTGRTGTVIACDMLIREFEVKRVVDIARCVYQLRRCRAGAVQTRDQYAFIYQVLNTYSTKLTGGALDLA